MSLDVWKEKLNEMIDHAGIPNRPSYRPGEVCLLLGISDRTFWRMTERYERDPNGNPAPGSIDSFLLRRERRVRFDALAEFLMYNNTWQRKHADDPRQIMLPFS